MRLFLSVSMMAAALLTTPATAGDKKPVDPNKKVCRRDYGSTGSILPKSVCHTVAEWKSVDDANRMQTDAMRDQRTALPSH